MKTAHEKYVDHINGECVGCEAVVFCSVARRLLEDADREGRKLRRAALAPVGMAS